MTERDKLSGTLTMAVLAIVGWMMALLETTEFRSLGRCLDQVIAEQSAAGTNNPIIIGMTNGSITASDPLISWIKILLDAEMAARAEVPIDDSSPRGPPQAKLIA